MDERYRCLLLLNSKDLAKWGIVDPFQVADESSVNWLLVTRLRRELFECS